MTEGGGSNVPEESAVPTPAIPVNDPLHPHPVGQSARPMLSYRSPGSSEERLITIRRIGAMEAQLAQAKLQSEGVRCFIADENISAVYSFVVSNVQLQVAQADMARAEELLSRPADDSLKGEYAAEDWRCPRCHRKEVDLLPLSAGWRAAAILCLALYVLPIVYAMIKQLSSNQNLIQVADRLWGMLGFIWFLSVIVLSVKVLLLKRRKRCRVCGNEWTKGERAADN